MVKKIISLILILSMLIFTLSACGKVKPQVNEDTYEDVENIKDEEKENIGILDGVTFYDEEINNDILKQNRVTMINIWATFCPPCLHEMPDLGEINREYKEAGKDFAVVGICTDVVDWDGNINEDSLELAKEIVEITAADYTNILPGKALIGGFLSKVSAVPTTLFVNNEGDILKTVIGARSKDDWIVIIEEVMAEM